MSLGRIFKNNQYVKPCQIITHTAHSLKVFCSLLMGAVVLSVQSKTDSDCAICWAGRFSHLLPCHGASRVLHPVHSQRLIHPQRPKANTDHVSLSKHHLLCWIFRENRVNCCALRVLVHAAHEEERLSSSWLDVLVQRNGWGRYASRWKDLLHRFKQQMKKRYACERQKQQRQKKPIEEMRKFGKRVIRMNNNGGKRGTNTCKREIRQHRSRD